MPKIRVADYVAAFLEERGVRKVFLLSGGGMMHLLDALGRRDRLGYVCNHHEQASAMAAEGYARESGGLGVCYATSGPGATNTITGVVGAWLDSSPILVVSGQSKLSQTIRHTGIADLRQFGTFEVDIVPIVRSITKYAAFVDDPESIRWHLEKAFALATGGRPGPVWLDVPLDVQGALIDADTLPSYEDESPPVPALGAEVLDELIGRLRSARRPLILAGHGVRVSGEVERFRRLMRALNVPVAVTPMASDLMPYEHDLLVGRVGLKADRPGNMAVQTADLILTVGCSLHVMTTGYELDQFAPGAFKIQVEIDPAILQREQVGVQMKVRASVQDLLSGLEARMTAFGGRALRTDGAWLQRCRTWKSELSVAREPHQRDGDEINYYDFNDVLSDACESHDTIVTDAGSAFYVIGQAFRVKDGQRVIISGGLGTMGFALPAAVGACSASPDRRVVCVTGDGSLQTNVHDLATMRHHGLNLKLFVLNNQGYVSIRNTQDNFFQGHHVGTDEASGVSFPDLQQLAAAYGIPFLSSSERATLHSVVNQALSTPGPVFCEVRTPYNQAIIPSVASRRMPDGRMQSQPLHNMSPFMDEEVLKRLLNVPD